MQDNPRGSSYASVKANRLAFHPGARNSEEPSFFSFVLDGKLAGMALPTSEAQLRTLKEKYNVGLVCSLIESRSCPPIEMFEPQEEAPESLHIEWADMSAPTRQQMDELLRISHEYIQRSLAVVYHCFGGKGRTGTALACYLLRFHGENWNADSVIQHIRELRPNSIETSSQELFIKNYERFLKGEDPIEEISNSEEKPKWFTIKLRKVNQDANPASTDSSS